MLPFLSWHPLGSFPYLQKTEKPSPDWCHPHGSQVDLSQHGSLIATFPYDSCHRKPWFYTWSHQQKDETTDSIRETPPSWRLATGGAPSLSAISRLADPPLDNLSTNQLRHFLQSLQKASYTPRDLIPFESLCSTGEPSRHTLSLLYSYLITQTDEPTLTFVRQWGKDLGIQFSPRQVKKILFLAHKSSIANQYQEIGYKIVSCSYRVPYILHKMDVATSDKCWRCNAEVGTILHIFWACPALGSFWEEVTTTIKSLTSVELKGNPAACLLHLTERPIRKYKKTLTMQLLNAARACIPA